MARAKFDVHVYFEWGAYVGIQTVSGKLGLSYNQAVKQAVDEWLLRNGFDITQPPVFTNGVPSNVAPPPEKPRISLVDENQVVQSRPEPVSMDEILTVAKAK